MTTATVEKTIDYDVVIAESTAQEKVADARAVELRATQKDLVKRSLREDTSKELSRVERQLDEAARDAERARARRQAALEEQQSAGVRGQAESRARARTELAALDKQRHRHLSDVEELLQKLQAELQVLRTLEVAVIQRRSELGLGTGIDLRRLVSDRLAWLLGRAAGPAGLGGMPPLTSKGQARQPLDQVFAPADVVAEDRGYE